MSTPDRPDTPPLTRRQLREIRNTGATPIIVAEVDDDAVTTADATSHVDAADPAHADAGPVEEQHRSVESDEVAEPQHVDEPQRADEPQHVVAPLAREAEPAVIPPAPEPEELGVSPLTRRQARQQERIRTASVPVITPDIAAAHTPTPSVISQVPTRDDASAPADETPTDRAPLDDAPAAVPAATADEPTSAASIVDVLDTTDDEDADASRSAEDEGAPEPAVLLNPALGSDLLAGDTPAVALPPSFDQLIARSASATGSVSTPNALILSQTPAGAPLVAPVTATGEVLITGSFDLPDGLGSLGHVPGTADGKELDVALIDGELPPASSPTPVAASAAISTVRGPGEEIIRPPAPEKGRGLMLGLILTAGVLGLAVVSVLVALTTGAIG